METRRILMRSLAVVVIASVIWTITADAEMVYSCCTRVSTAKVTEPIIGYRMQEKSLPCVKAVIFQTKHGDFCSDWRQPWVERKVLQFFKAQRNKRHSTTTNIIH
ncbi:C-C motif chemokine 20-like [Sinocyclocheilus rhinocerous]|uniref:C-C motif chemokine 20-like n=1 Tax=Sinocyclocheilus rhinocerous TaxID=307959 RepID=UPI0007B8EF4A|nr:PREDICTED: C-C motif chemokine 20-like [Sinocyclocheilus rhinocerous]